MQMEKSNTLSSSGIKIRSTTTALSQNPADIITIITSSNVNSQIGKIKIIERPKTDDSNNQQNNIEGQRIVSFPITSILQEALLGDKSAMHSHQFEENSFPYSTPLLRELLFNKYFKRHPNINTDQFKKEETALKDILFDFVLHVPIIIDGHKVKRRSWAKAFYEMDVIQSAKCLFEALFTHDEMSNCTLNGKAGTQELSAVKMLAILRASCWMKNKCQDPYSFNPEEPTHNVHPSKDEQDKIEKKVFTERRSQANRKIMKIVKRKGSPNQDIQESKRAIGEGDSDSQHSEIYQTDNQDTESVKSEGSFTEHNYIKTCVKKLQEENINLNEEFGELEQLYYRCPDDFLDVFMPNRKDIFIDGILIPRKKWEEAYLESQRDIIKTAWILFKTLFTDHEIMNCTLNGKNGTAELCPVRKLSIIRAVQWMSKNSKDLSKIYYFDSDDDECNLFPSEEDKERIETKVFTEKRYQQSRHLTTKSSSR